jgi:sec-independent protein translocase protein TatA
MPFRVGPTELIIILVVVMIIFGVGRLPEIGGAMGKAIREFRSTVSGAKEDEPEDQEAVEAGTESGKKT